MVQRLHLFLKELCQFPGIGHSSAIGGMVNQNRVMNNPQFGNQQLPAPPSYHQQPQGKNRYLCVYNLCNVR